MCQTSNLHTHYFLSSTNNQSLHFNSAAGGGRNGGDSFARLKSEWKVGSLLHFLSDKEKILQSCQKGANKAIFFGFIHYSFSQKSKIMLSFPSMLIGGQGSRWQKSLQQPSSAREQPAHLHTTGMEFVHGIPCWLVPSKYTAETQSLSELKQQYN